MTKKTAITKGTHLFFFFCMYFHNIMAPNYTEACLPYNFPPHRNFFPTYQEQKVPVSTEIWIFYDMKPRASTDYLAQVKLRETGGKEIPATAHLQPRADLSFNPYGGYLVILKPHTLLSPHRSYEILTTIKEWSCSAKQPIETCVSSDYHVSSTFTTGNSIDQTPPSFRGWKDFQLEGEDISKDGFSCGRFHYFPFRMTWHKAEDSVSEHLLRYEIYAADNLNTPVFSQINQNYVSGAEDCIGNSVPMNYYFRHNPNGYVIRVSDLSGNTSPFSDKLIVPKRCGVPQEPVEAFVQDGSTLPEVADLHQEKEPAEQAIVESPDPSEKNGNTKPPLPETTSPPLNSIGCQFSSSFSTYTFFFSTILLFLVFLWRKYPSFRHAQHNSH